MIAACAARAIEKVGMAWVGKVSRFLAVCVCRLSQHFCALMPVSPGLLAASARQPKKSRGFTIQDYSIIISADMSPTFDSRSHAHTKKS